jgi:DNA-binding NtrC family response regulator
MRVLIFAMSLRMNAMMENGRRVLVVDDDEDVRQVITDRLEQVGFTVVQACDGLGALAEMHQRHFDVVVTDCNMPHLNGLDLLRQCQIAWPGTPVIIMSAALGATDELAAARGAFECLRKPFDADQLIALVGRAARVSGRLVPPASGSESNAGG